MNTFVIATILRTFLSSVAPPADAPLPAEETPAVAESLEAEPADVWAREDSLVADLSGDPLGGVW